MAQISSTHMSFGSNYRKSFPNLHRESDDRLAAILHQDSKLRDNPWEKSLPTRSGEFSTKTIPISCAGQDTSLRVGMNEVPPITASLSIVCRNTELTVGSRTLQSGPDEFADIS